MVVTPGTGVKGISIAPTIAAGSFQGISITPTLTGQQTLMTAISVDCDYSGGDINAYGIDVDIQQTGETSGSPAIGSRGNIQGIRSDARVAYTIDDAYALRGSCYVLPSAAEEANDCVGVFATIQHTGAITRGATTSSFSAMKADVSNSSSGSWTGQMYGLMISFGSNVNYGDTSAMIYGYTHADARADYGIYLNNYSPYMLAGIRLGETAGATPVMESGLWISSTWGDVYNTGAILIAGDQSGTALAYGANATGVCVERINVTAQITGGNYFFGRYMTLASSGSFGTTGFIMGDYVKVTVSHLVQEVYGTRGRVNVAAAQAGNTSNQFVGVFGGVDIDAVALALADTGGCYGVLGTATIAASGTLDQPLIAGYFDIDPAADIAGVCLAVRARMQNYTDYGVEVFCQTSNATAGFHIRATAAATLPVGILFTGENVGGQGVITKALKFAAATNCGVAANTTDFPDDAGPTAFHMIVDVAGTNYYIPMWDNTTWT